MDFIVSGCWQAILLLVRGDPATYSAVRTTLQASGLSLLASLVLGLPVGFWLGYSDFRGKRGVRLVTDTLLFLPTVFIGLMVYAFISARGPLGASGLLFTIPGIAIGQTILALPIVISLVASAVETTDRNLRLTLQSLGAAGRQIFWTSLWETRHAVVAAALVAAGRVMTEVGISMMVGGNIKWHTRTITTAIALETGKGMFATGIALGLILLLLALVLNLGVMALRQK